MKNDQDHLDEPTIGWQDDPRLTAYALRETAHLTAADVAEIEALVANDPDARALVEEIRDTAAAVEAGLSGPVSVLTADQRTEVLAAAAAAAGAPVTDRRPDPTTAARPAVPPRPRLYRPDWFPLLTAAAAAALIGFVWAENLPERRPVETARVLDRRLRRAPDDGLRYREFFDDSRDGDFRGRTENVFDGELDTRSVEIAQAAGIGDPLAPILTIAGGTSGDGEWKTVEDGALRAGAPTTSANTDVTSGPVGTPEPEKRDVSGTPRAFNGAGRGAPAGVKPGDSYPGSGGGYLGPGSEVPPQPARPRPPADSSSGSSAHGFRPVPSGGASGPGTIGIAGGGGAGGSPVAGGRFIRSSTAESAPAGKLRVDFTRGEDLLDSTLSTASWDTVTRADLTTAVLGLRNVVEAQDLPRISAFLVLTDTRTAEGGVGAGDAEGDGALTLLDRAFLSPGDFETWTSEVEGEVSAESVRRVRRYVEHWRRTRTAPGTERYGELRDNPFQDVRRAPLSTFSVDVDTASYANVRRFIGQGALPPPDAVRIEELVNYFRYDYREPVAGDVAPFSVNLEVAACPWNLDHRLVRVGLKGRSVVKEERKASNLVFLLDVSGSMKSQDKLPLLQQSMKLLVREMREEDQIGIVVYSGQSRVALESTPGSDKETILRAIDGLSAGGSTNGEAGIRDAYAMARKCFVKGGSNRVLLGTDGDFNVGVSSTGELVTLIENEAKSGVFLSVLGFGTGNIKEDNLEQIADRGNGQFHYVDSLREGRKVLVEQMGGTLETIAKDVKLQVEFNPRNVTSYRLVGYANRMLAAQDFNDDTKDAGDIGAGHTVTALYEVVPAGLTRTAGVDPLRYQPKPEEPREAEPDLGPDTGSVKYADEMLTVKLRWKEPDGTESNRVDVPLRDGGAGYTAASSDYKFASAVAAFGMLLRDSPYRGGTSYAAVLELAAEGLGDDVGGYRTEFLDLVRQAKALAGR